MITIPTADLVGILADVVPFALDAEELPHINCVRLEWDGEQLHTQTTDTYRMAWSSWKPGDIAPGEDTQDDMFTEWGSGDAPWSMTVNLDEAKELVKVFKLGPKEGQTPITVDYAADRWNLTVVRARETGHSAITMVVPDTRVEFANLRALLSRYDRLIPVTGASYNAKWLADFAKVRPRGPMRMRFCEGFTGIEIGERFVGGITPVKAGA